MLMKGKFPYRIARRKQYLYSLSAVILIFRDVWGPGYINQSQYLRVFIAQLRKKLEPDPNRPEMILTESGVGYRFVCREK